MYVKHLVSMIRLTGDPIRAGEIRQRPLSAEESWRELWLDLPHALG